MQPVAGRNFQILEARYVIANVSLVVAKARESSTNTSLIRANCLRCGIDRIATDFRIV